MPELPEVEFARRCLARWLTGHTVTGIEAPAGRVVSPRARRLLPRIAGGTLVDSRRHGKWITLVFKQDLRIGLHLGMTGKVVLEPAAMSVRWPRLVFTRDDGAHVTLSDARQLGHVVAGDEIPTLAGPDALLALPTAPALRLRAGSRTLPIKALLMDQAFLAGLGNIQATEAMFAARVHPDRGTQTLTPAEWTRLRRAIVATLRRTLQTLEGDAVTYVNEGGPNPFVVYGHAGEPCPRCGAKLEMLRISGRSSVFCGRCQRL